jgi:mono/diheme cytochrome c family protein
MQTRQRRHLLQEVFMEKPLRVLMIGLAMFLTIGALAASSLTIGETRPGEEPVAASPENTVAKQPSPETAKQSATNRAAGGASSSEIERGKYLVENVAMCVECHTPRDSQGALRTDAWLAGAPIWIRPVAPIQNWADHAPSLAGWPSFTEEQGERVLEKGTGPEGEELRPPMHIYHMKHEDAKAIIAYLKSLPRSSQTY